MQNDEMGLRPVQRFFRLLELDRKDITYIYVYAIFAGLITLALPLGVQAIIGLIAGGAMSASLILLVTIVTLTTALAGILKVMQLTVTESIQRRIFTRSAFDFSYRLPRLNLEALSGKYAPELVNRFFDTLTLQKGLPKILMDFSTAILQILFGLILISFYHSFFIFFAFVLIVILFLIMRLTGPSGLKTSLQESKYKYEVAYWLEELARSMNTFKLAGGTDLSLRRTDGLVSNYLDSRKQHFRILLFQYGNIVAFKTLITAGLLFLGSYLVIDNQINIGQFVAAEIVVILVMASVEKLILTMETIYDVLTALEKLGNVTDLPLDPEQGLSFEEIDRQCGMVVEVEDLTFQYPDSEKPTLNGVSLSVRSGEKICLAGYNGAGKSTLVQIVAGLHTNFKGVLAYNGFPFGSLNLASLRSHIGDYCFQEDIFKGSIIDNIGLGHKDVNLEMVIRAADEVGLSKYVERLPNGYQTMLLPEGKNIPQNIRIKIILARAVVSQPRLLAIEGFFNSLDQEDRQRIADFLTAGNCNWTLLAVSNDPVLASRCDRIVIMKDGNIIETGTFAQIQNSEHYRAVFKVNEYDMLPNNGLSV